MLIPSEIQAKKFSKSLRGYKETEVDSFLEEITINYEKIYQENIELKEKMESLVDQINHYSSLEQTIQKTLVIAQSASDEITLNARKKAENIVSEAELEYKKKLQNGNEEIRKLKHEYENLTQEIETYKLRFKSMILSQLSIVDGDLESSIAEGYRLLGKKTDKKESKESEPEIKIREDSENDDMESNTQRIDVKQNPASS